LEHLTGKNIFEKFILWFEKQLTHFTAWMTILLRWSLAHKAITLGVTLTLLIVSFMLIGMGYVGGEFIPKGDRGQFIVALELPKDASLETTNQMTMKAEAILQRQPLIIALTTTVGQSSDGGGTSQATAYKAEITVTMVPEKERTERSDLFAASVQELLSERLIGAKVKTMPVSILGTAERASIDLVVMGASQDSAMHFARQALDALRQLDGVANPRLSAEEGNPEVHVALDRDKMASLGLTMDVVGGTMQTAFSGTKDDSRLKFSQGEYEYDLNLRYDNFNRRTPTTYAI
jgi:HAE1 family hydrophobic/amphiphilic exporter-1